MSNMVYLGECDAGLLEAVGDRMMRKADVMLDPAEALLLSRGDKLTVFKERSRRFPHGCKAEYIHCAPNSGLGRLRELHRFPALHGLF